MAPNYAEESRDPKKIMGPATYISVIGLGVLYTFITWMLVVAWGADGVSKAGSDAINGLIPNVFAPQTDRVFGFDLGSASLLTSAFQLSIVSGSFACQLAFFNTATRYLFSMGRENVLPRSLGRTHRVHHSAFVASSVVGVLCAGIIGMFLAYDSSTLGALTKLGTWAPMMGNIGILSLMALVSLAVLVYFVRDGAVNGASAIVRVVICPLVASGGLVYAAYLLVDGRRTLGFAKGVFFIEYMQWFPVAMFVAGAALALYYRATDPARYAGIGRYLHEDVAAA
jgi:amino acid transporter